MLYERGGKKAGSSSAVSTREAVRSDKRYSGIVTGSVVPLWHIGVFDNGPDMGFGIVS
jgi:hypothetical protein